ncbi:hypothetical protein AB4Z25_18415 [Rhizobium sp. RAF36]|uniref:hypothetical protein n=1 Tax=Rhizobium sp. RAF36 TaxID=3233055 RepID=UPI003F96EA73
MERLKVEPLPLRKIVGRLTDIQGALECAAIVAYNTEPADQSEARRVSAVARSIDCCVSSLLYVMELLEEIELESRKAIGKRNTA